jgi:ubiquinone/menaquinone biosynthesis C-methylase UbiE
VAGYFEQIWAGVGDDAHPEHFAERSDFLLGQVAPGERVLDLGCGQGEFVAALVAHGVDAVGTDIAAEPLRRARLRYPDLQFMQCSEVLPFSDGEFAAVWAGELLEHVQDGLGLLSEVLRVLSSDGQLLSSTPDHGWRRRVSFALSARRFAEHFDPRSDHVRFFTARSLEGLLDAAGFEQVAVRSRSGTLYAVAQQSASG